MRLVVSQKKLWVWGSGALGISVKGVGFGV